MLKNFVRMFLNCPNPLTPEQRITQIACEALLDGDREQYDRLIERLEKVKKPAPTPNLAAHRSARRQHEANVLFDEIAKRTR